MSGHLVLAACSGGGSLSLSAKAGSAASTAARAPSQTQLNVGNGIVISRVRMVVRRIKLQSAEVDGGGEERELKAGPFLIDLNATALDGGTIQKVFDADVPAGTYRKIKFEIHKLESSEASADARFSDLIDKSVVVEGTVDGTRNFTYVSSLNEEQEREGTFKVTAGGDNVTLNVDPSKWFMDGSTRLDPSASGVDHSKVDANIKASLDAFEDDDDDGRKDD